MAKAATTSTPAVVDDVKISIEKIFASRKETKSYSRVFYILLSDGNVLQLGWEKSGSLYCSVCKDNSSIGFSMNHDSYEVTYKNGNLSISVPEMLKEMMRGEIEIDSEDEEKPKVKKVQGKKLKETEAPPKIVEKDYVPDERAKRGRKPKEKTLSKKPTSDSCSVHFNYHGKRKPATDCKECWEMYRRISPKLAEKV